MDSLTHLVAGAITPVAFAHAPKRTSLLMFGILAGQLPDIDIFFGHSPEFLLTQHRGLTHAFVLQPFMALALAMPFAIILSSRPKTRQLEHAGPVPQDYQHSFGMVKLFGIALFAGIMHIMLDLLNGFGTQAFLPFSEGRFELNAVFIVDLLLTLPPLALLIWMLLLPAVPVPETATGSWRAILRQPVKKRKILPGYGFFSAKAQILARIALIWIVIYPLAVIGIKHGLEVFYTKTWNLGQEEKLVLMAEPFSPFAWKAVVEDGQTYKMVTLFPLSSTSLSLPKHSEDWRSFNIVDKTFYAGLEKQAKFFTYFKNFSPDMHQILLHEEIITSGHYAGKTVRTYAFDDMRYVMSPKSAAHAFRHSDANFVLEARVREDGTLLEYRFLNRGNDRDTTKWLKP